MGAWGSGMFDTDDAWDWLYVFAAGGASSVDYILETAGNALKKGYVEAPEGAALLAAAELIAVAHGHPPDDFDSFTFDEDNSVAELSRRHEAAVAALAGAPLRAAQLVEAIGSDGEASELLQLWQDSEDGADEFSAACAELAARLRRIP